MWGECAPRGATTVFFDVFGVGLVIYSGCEYDCQNNRVG